ncbi:amino acid/amide ABC transporter membrane protein 1, HAAT family (TC 3.A.1.4.-) [Modestobacter sp. DSM 44400]|uniref:branched-chain amino acid ABC transporter permease n=1 Tax=Modestobacter sp. DSM 44400 TaxID=1550230 RepID=UPI0008982410|nr:branched-chain amino acid ABC transporter permease [Modestobacter sp. DSM 44400]SDY95236.1 amino acid/amide ABC transporter membrane protein 1, HAAT family (TC 3.A.1.4.-) [Modestobacter sp. DSM 44400]
MAVDRLIASAFDVLSLTSILVLLVLGMGVIVSMMGIFNLAHGELVLLGALTVYLVDRASGLAWLGIIAAPILVGAVGYLLERTVIRRFYARPIAALLGTWALGLVIRELVRVGIGGVSKSVRAPLFGSVNIGGASLSSWRIVIIVATVAVMTLSYLFLVRTSLGLKVRATLDNPILAQASGIATNRVYAGTFAFGAALAGLAGALVVPLQSLYPELGVTFLMRSFLAVMVGGMGSFEAPILGAGLIGVPSGILPVYMSAVFSDMLVFVLAIVLMRLRPAGLFRRGRTE